MKRKYIALLLSAALSLSILNGCGGTDKERKTNRDVSQNEEDGEAVYGEVSEIEESTITIKLGTRKEMERPEKSEGNPSQQESGEIPEKPSGEIPEKPSEERQEGASGEKPSGERPEGEGDQQPKGKQMPEGELGELPSMLELTGEEQEIAVTEDTLIKRQNMGGPDHGEEQGEEITIADLSEGDTVQVLFTEDGNAKEIIVMSGGPGGGMDQQSKPENYVSVKEYSEDIHSEGESIHSEGTDENAILISQGASAKLKNFSISRESQDSTGGDQASFYGVGAAVLAEGGCAYLSDSSITTDAAGGAGIFAYGAGTVYAADTFITTQQDASGGIHAAGGGTLYAWDMKVETNGESAAAIRSDRGSGTMVIDGGTYVSNGVGSPAVYSTAEIAVNHGNLTANGSEAVCIEGLNSLRLYDTNLTGTMGEDDRNDCVWNVILYQSMSGDAEEGNSTFEMQGGTLKSNHGGMFYTTNTESTIMLSGVTLENASDSLFFLKCTGNQNQRGWGMAGANGADCLFTASSQSMEGDIIWDSISELDFYMEENSSLTGAVKQDESCAGDGGEGYCNLYLGQGCTWTVTGDSSLSTLSSQGSIADDTGKAVTVQGTDGTVYVEGDSSYTITVENYSDNADFSEAPELTKWADYQVEKPSEFA